MKINPEKYYSLHSIFKMKALPWIKSFATLQKLVAQDIDQGGDKFKAIKTGQNQGTRYLIKGSNLIELLQRMDKEGFDLNRNA